MADTTYRYQHTQHLADLDKAFWIAFREVLRQSSKKASPADIAEQAGLLAYSAAEEVGNVRARAECEMEKWIEEDKAEEEAEADFRRRAMAAGVSLDTPD